MVIIMGICHRFDFWVDEGEPYCPEFCYDGTDNVNSVHGSDMFTVNGFGHDKRNVEDELEEIMGKCKECWLWQSNVSTVAILTMTMQHDASTVGWN